jgi:DNA (cytosine-5)-methyltransferase 1
VDYTEQSPTILSLCPGGLRGIEIGFDAACERIGWKRGTTLAYVEIEAFIIENLVQQMEQGLLDPAPVWSNVKTFLPIAKRLAGKVDWIFGGYPCQPFSTAGLRKGTEDPRHLFPFIERIIEAVGPVGCFFENVAGHLTMGFPEVYAILRSMGYSVEAGLFTAEEVGAPHERERLFILAIRSDMVNTHDFQRGLPKSKGWHNYAQAFRPGSRELVNTNCSGQQIIRDHRILVEQSDKGISHTSAGVGLANTCSTGREWSEWCGAFQNKNKTSLKSITERCLFNRWPAYRGQSQYTWEAPRTESRMGFTVNGYNYREDLLRMAGNGVVWQTAELAFITLLQKFKQ